MSSWQFWIDCGGTFTDVVALSATGQINTCKLLSDNPSQYDDAVIAGIRKILKLKPEQAIPVDKIDSVKLGTTVATNALLEHKGERNALLITRGFKDALKIAYQNRPDLFAKEIILPEQLYQTVVEIDERIQADGSVEKTLPESEVLTQLQQLKQKGYESIAIVLMHAYQFKQHEQQLATLAKIVGFRQVSVSHQVSPLIKLIARGDTTVVDAYLSPILKHYINRVSEALPNVKLFFMQSNGGLTSAQFFQGKDSILSGPAGGVVGAQKTAAKLGFNKVIMFDMGGTSTDVSHFAGEYEKNYSSEIAGVRLRVPMLNIHTIAAGGGSILKYQQGRLQVGPQSAGANPGPACYGNGGPLTMTDCNLLLGRLLPDHFPQIFGEKSDNAIDLKIVSEKFQQLSEKIPGKTAMQLADGFLQIAVNNMAAAIKKISVQKGHDVSDYVLNCFGGAAAQHACLVAENLTVTKILIHPLASVLSAYGIGVTDIINSQSQSIEKVLSEQTEQLMQATWQQLQEATLLEIKSQISDKAMITVHRKMEVRYQGSDVSLILNYKDGMDIAKQFERQHLERYGFILPKQQCVIATVICEINAHEPEPALLLSNNMIKTPGAPVSEQQMWINNNRQQVDVYQWSHLQVKQVIIGPAIIVSENTTVIVETNWQAQLQGNLELLLTYEKTESAINHITQVDPIKLEIFNNSYMSIAEQMGEVLRNTASSVNIKERLDFSCAVFDAKGCLIANAPHIPVHLGSMSASVQTILKAHRQQFQQGDVYVLNNPYNGGTHLPDITVITPVLNQQQQLLFFIASRGHHADIGGITPGSMPPDSKMITEEGVLIDDLLLVKAGEFQYDSIKKLLLDTDYPSRNVEQNINDLKAQIAANQVGVNELLKMVEHFSLDVVQAYMQHVQTNAEHAVESVITKLTSGNFTHTMDNGLTIKVAINIDHAKKSAHIDFTGSSPMAENNFNAPTAVTRAAALYVFRTLVEETIPMNEGCLKPITITIPDNCFLNPSYPAAVVAGNVETSQVIVDCLFAALNEMAAAQGTMNNLTFGNQQYQYYETIAGGSGAGKGFNGADAVQTHMTNSRLTDPEILELRYPVIIDSFAIRPDSGGKGKWQGGNGVVRKIKFLQPMTVSILSNHRKIPPFGLAGGQAAQAGNNYVIKQSGEKQRLSASAKVELTTGDMIVIETPGGGGYGERM